MRQGSERSTKLNPLTKVFKNKPQLKKGTKRDPSRKFSKINPNWKKEQRNPIGDDDETSQLRMISKLQNHPYPLIKHSEDFRNLEKTFSRTMRKYQNNKYPLKFERISEILRKKQKQPRREVRDNV